MFYVLYSTSADNYLDADGDYCEFANAERFAKPDERVLKNAKQYAEDDIRWVGPCEEGEEP